MAHDLGMDLIADLAVDALLNPLTVGLFMVASALLISGAAGRLLELCDALVTNLRARRSSRNASNPNGRADHVANPSGAPQTAIPAGQGRVGGSRNHLSAEVMSW
jgi:hypothetical protein